jgi:hypothetical protein
LALRIGVKRVGLDFRAVLQQRIQDVDCFPDAAQDETGEQGNVLQLPFLARQSALGTTVAFYGEIGAWRSVSNDLSWQSPGGSATTATKRE